MSVINQVLNQLEQRGAHTAAEQTMVRAVPQTGRNFIMPLLAFGLFLMIVIVAWQWTRKPVLSSVEEPVLSLSKGPVLSSVEGTGVQYQPAETVAPASRLSFELSSVPLPIPVQPAKKQPKNNAASNAKVAAQTSHDASKMKQVSAAQLADAEFRKAAALMQQGRINEALAGYEAALRLDAGHDAARQALVALLLEGKRGTDAERVLQERLNNKPDHTGFTMLLARLQVERGAVAEATATLEKALPYAQSQADYQAFLAALLQRQNRNDEAIAHYQIALQLASNNGIWQMGYGISLQALQRNTDAKDAFKHALDTQTLSPDLQAFVQQKIKGL